MLTFGNTETMAEIISFVTGMQIILIGGKYVVQTISAALELSNHPQLHVTALAGFNSFGLT